MRLNNTIMKLRIRKVRHGFTLVELIVVISIVAVLMALVLSGVNGTREAARRVHCSNSLRQLGLGLHSFHSVHDRFPLGNDALAGSYKSWITSILPQIEQTSIAERFDSSLPWEAPNNFVISHTVIPTLRCPSSVLDFDGDTDYAGIRGSALSATSHEFDLNNGVLIQSKLQRRHPVSVPEIVDGSSYTIFIGEAVDRPEEFSGMWADGKSCISHNNGGINNEFGNDIFSLHPGGAYAVFADGAVKFMHESIDAKLIGALCSRGGLEDVNEFFTH